MTNALEILYAVSNVPASELSLYIYRVLVEHVHGGDLLTEDELAMLATETAALAGVRSKTQLKRLTIQFAGGAK
jgi:hypothetical protein